MSGLKRPYGDGNLQAMGSPLNNRNVVIKESDILVQKIDEVSAAVTYVGKAQCGANVAGAIWQIYGIYISDIWHIYLGYMADILRIYRGYIADIWRICGGYIADIWRIYGGYMADN